MGGNVGGDVGVMSGCGAHITGYGMSSRNCSKVEKAYRTA